MGFNSDIMIMGFNSDFVGFNNDLIGFIRD
jgi:hypothetical protein